MRPRSERGATAIITAFMVVVLFGIAALSVDLGNAFARRTDNQTQADYGALAAARKQTTTAKSSMTITTDMVNAVVTAMNNNQPQDDTSTCWTTKTCITATMLTDGQLANGEIRYCGTGGPSCGTNYASTVKGVQVFAPRNKIDYGFANLLGVSSGHVQADALVNVFTAGKRVMPMYAVQGCDYGLQTLADPANNVSTPVVPTLAYNADTNNTNLAAASGVIKDASGTVSANVPLNSTNYTFTFTAGKFAKTRYIGFFRGDDSDPLKVQKTKVFWLDGDATKTPLNPVPPDTGYDPGNQNQTVTVTIPAAVAQTPAIWWIRVFDDPDATGKWSKASEALPIRVGDTVLECASGPSAGNFGTLKFPRTDVTSSEEIPANIANGLQPPMTAEVHQWAVQNSTSTGLCTDGLDGAVVSTTTLRAGTNCVDTDTGLSAQFATKGLVQGGGAAYAGVLTTQNTRTGCSPNGSNSNRNINLNSVGYSINDDVLSCYFTDTSTSIYDIAKASYTAGVKLDPAILRSPRFFYVPVLKIQPGSGGSQTYSIIDFRAAFLTDETATTSATKGSHTGTNNNGVVIQGQDIKQLKVVFFNDDALPVDGDIPLIDYLGSGNRVIRLID
ncbi:Tad domain-containing protein [Nocardioides agariphilus]|uniref:Tad domain-containing protein n=1 Tax=Nocardioides agariphilus TaxID=433664 RepID=A0A930YR60_9ACTN|nr:Tad domain-containing protein [Nocardioides agariphilus]